MADRSRIVPIILSGGAGVRMWPLSRELYPKQLLPLLSERSLLQETAARVGDGARFAPPLIVCNEEHRFIIAEQLRRMGTTPDAIVLEPVARETAAACAVGALKAVAAAPDALVLILPADHRVLDAAAFAAAVATAEQAAAAGHLVTFGLPPTSAESGYGYILAGDPLPTSEGVRRVAAFVEKPAPEVAESYLADGRYLWNSGMFLFAASRLLEEMERHAPAVLDAARRALAQGRDDLDFLRLGAAFADAPSLSIDRAVMEKTDAAVVVPCDLGWADIGSWSSLWTIAAKDGQGNVCVGDVATEDAHNCYIRSDGHLAAVVGVDDAVVVVTDDAVLVAGRDRAHDVEALVERLKAQGRTEPLIHRKVHRPWGSYQGLHTGERFQVKCLTIAPGARLSLQKHYHRAEHWVVVQGTALVTRGTEEILVYENQSVHIPIGTLHRLENPGKVPLNIIEVQSGSYLGEDDIVRTDDSYGRS